LAQMFKEGRSLSGQGPLREQHFFSFTRCRDTTHERAQRISKSGKARTSFPPDASRLRASPGESDRPHAAIPIGGFQGFHHPNKQRTGSGAGLQKPATPP